MTRLAETLVECSRVGVICGPAIYERSAIAETAEISKDIAIYRTDAPPFSRNNLLGRLIRSAWLSVGLALSVARQTRSGDTLVTVTNPATALPLIAFIAQLKRLVLIVVVHDVFPENLVAAGIVPRDGWIFSALLSLFNGAYRTAAKLVVIGRDMAELLTDKLGPSGPQIVVIENWADVASLSPSPRQDDGTVRLQFAGNMGRVQGLLPLLDALSQVKNPVLRVDFAGSGALRTRIEQVIHERELTNVRVLPPFSRAGQQQVLNSCDIGIVSLASGMTGLGVPSKAYNILAVGKPILVIGPHRSEIARMVTENEIGWVFEEPGPELINFLETLTAAQRPILHRMGRRARELAETRYSQRRQLTAYRQLICAR